MDILKHEKMSKNLLAEDKLKKIMPIYSEENFEHYVKVRKENIDFVSEDFKDGAKSHYYELIGEVDLLFNNYDTRLIKGIQLMLEDLVKKNAKDPIQLLSFCFIDSGYYSLRLAGYKSVDEESHEQREDAIGYGDVGNYYLKDLSNLNYAIYSNEYSEKYESELDDLWSFVEHKKLLQIELTIKACVEQFNLSQLNITYPLYVYLDIQDSYKGSGIFVTKLTN